MEMSRQTQAKNSVKHVRKQYEVHVFVWKGQPQEEWPLWLVEAGAYTEADLPTLLVIPQATGKGFAHAKDELHIVCELDGGGGRKWLDGFLPDRFRELFEPA